MFLTQELVFLTNIAFASTNSVVSKLKSIMDYNLNIDNIKY